jgi:hypothetical protein
MGTLGHIARPCAPSPKMSIGRSLNSRPIVVKVMSQQKEYSNKLQKNTTYTRMKSTNVKEK